MTEPTVDVWMDFACPWSRMALTELDRALVEVAQPVTTRLRTLRVDPSAPLDYGQTTIEHLCADLGISAEQAQKMLDNVRLQGANFGLSFNFAIARGGNNFDAHRLLHLARKFDRELEFARRMFSAHFEEGLQFSDPIVLKNIAREIGLPSDEVENVLATDLFADAVIDDENRAQELGISNTPHFVINGNVALNGLQPVSVLVDALSLGH